jgi:hypothetical protein
MEGETLQLLLLAIPLVMFLVGGTYLLTRL